MGFSSESKIIAFKNIHNCPLLAELGLSGKANEYGFYVRFSTNTRPSLSSQPAPRLDSDMNNSRHLMFSGELGSSTKPIDSKVTDGHQGRYSDAGLTLLREKGVTALTQPQIAQAANIKQIFSLQLFLQPSANLRRV
jgi:hypothetical protein